MRDLEQIEGETTVREPSGVPRTPLGIEEIAKITERGIIQALDQGDDVALVGVRRVVVPLVPADPVQTEGQGNDQDYRKRSRGKNAVTVERTADSARVLVVDGRLGLRTLHESLLYLRGKTYSNAPRGRAHGNEGGTQGINSLQGRILDIL